MKKFSALFLLIFIFCFCSCDSNMAPFRSQTLNNSDVRTFKIYVSGAVANEGYVEVAEGSEWLDCVKLAGYISQAEMPKSPHGVITCDGALILRYYDGEKFCYSVNVNGALITGRREIENISAEVVDAISDYIENNGKITDRTQLKSILGELYEDNYYKFFVSENDYEKTD